jgi:hypothetical protein
VTCPWRTEIGRHCISIQNALLLLRSTCKAMRKQPTPCASWRSAPGGWSDHAYRCNISNGVLRSQRHDEKHDEIDDELLVSRSWCKCLRKADQASASFGAHGIFHEPSCNLVSSLTHAQHHAYIKIAFQLCLSYISN